MKKFLTLLFVCIYISSCGNQNIQDNSNTSSGNIQIKEETNSWSKQAAEDILEEIENTSQEDISKALQDFLSQETIDYKSEIQKTLERYNDNYWPVLEYKHAVKPKEEEEEEEEETASWDITDSDIENQEVDLDENNDNSQDEDNQENKVDEKQNYSWETQINDQSDKIEEDEDNKNDFTIITKNGSSGTYTSYQPEWNTCDGWLKMTDNQWEEKWLFYNTCDKIIYDFELDFGWINVFYKDEESQSWEEFVSIE